MDLSKKPEYNKRVSNRIRLTLSYKIEKESQTVIHSMWRPKGGRGSLVISDRLHLLCLSTDLKSSLLFTVDCPVNEQMTIDEENSMYFFTLIFEGLPKECRYFDLVDEHKDGWRIHSVMANKIGVYWVEIV